MRIFIEPNDVLMFRDGKPFSGGDDHFARGSFPPLPSTIYGALRSHLLSIKSGEFETFKNEPARISKDITDEIGNTDTLGTLEIKQFSLAKNDGGQIKQYFQMPRDIACIKGKDDSIFYILKPNGVIGSIVQTDLPSGLLHMWHETEEALEATSGFLSQDEMTRYLIGESPKKIIDSKKIYDTEERTGIRKSSSSRSVETGGLYSVEYFRMKNNFGFTLLIDGTQLMPETGIIRLGGDHRSAHYSACKWKDIDNKPIKDKVSKNKYFKLILLSPAIFKQDWLPDGIDINTFEWSIYGVKVKMLGACVGKPIGIGGFNMAKGMPKIMKKAAPAGSVYYFELANGNVDVLFENLWLKSISDERSKEGFGITLIGGF